MQRSLIVDMAYKSLTELCETVEHYGSVEEAIEVSQMLEEAKVRMDRIQGHPQGRPQQ